MNKERRMNMEIVYDVVDCNNNVSCNGDVCGNANLGCNTNTDD